MRRRVNRIQKAGVRSQKAARAAGSRVTSEHGVALILTLAIITLVTLLLIGFAVSMRVENTASKNFNEVYKARELANAAVDQAVAQLRQAMPVRTPPSGAATPFTTYVTLPGVIETNYFNGTPPTLVGSIPLYSTMNLGTTTNLSSGLWITGGTNNLGEFSGVDPQIVAGWHYVPQDPSLAFGPANPIIGRYAFWVDDDAAKINVNTAGVGAVPADAPYASAQKAIDLRQLLPNASAALFAANVQSGGPTYTPLATYPYFTIAEIMRAAPQITPDIFDDNQFSVTAYSDDSYYPNYTADLDAFGRQRLILDPTTLNTAVHINGPADGAYARLSDPALMQVCAAGGVAPAFADPAKYGPNGLKQIIANIIAYQMDPASPTLAPPDAGNSPPDYLGLARTPYINELQVQYDVQEDPPGSGSYTATRTVKVELFYMYTNDVYNPGIAESLTVTNLPEKAPALFTEPVTINVTGPFDNVNFIRVFSSSPETVPLPSSVILRRLPGSSPPSVTYKRGVNRLDYAEMDLPIPLLNLNTGANSTQSQDVEVDDPAVNDTTTRWGTASGSLGLQNAAYKQTADPTLPTTAIPSKAVMRVAKMKSVGELGYIHTPNPWQYLRLQPQPAAEKNAQLIPDWAILDIFAVDPAIVPKVTKGRININSTVSSSDAIGSPIPIPIGTTPAGIGRLVPLKALLSGVIVPGQLQTVAQDIYSGIYAATPPLGDKFGNQAAYDTIGEICEVQGLLDDPTNTKNQADREAAIRRIANLITVRSNTFTIWVIANSIKEVGTPPDGIFNGQDLITGEVRAQAVVERYEQGGLVKFRVRYFRYL